MSSLPASDHPGASTGGRPDLQLAPPHRRRHRDLLVRLAAPLRREFVAAWREPLLRNGHFLTMSSVGTALVGLLYWSLAAHLFNTTVVGRSSAVVSAMMLIGGVAQLNLISALVRFVPVAGGRTNRLVVTSYLTASVMAGVLGMGFIIVAPALSNQFRFVTTQPWMAVGLVVSSILWAVFVLQDSVLTGLRRAILVAVENAVFSIIKVIAVVALATVLVRDGILVSWWIGLVVAVVGTNLYLFRRAIPRHGLVTAPDPTTVSVRAVVHFAGPDYVGGLCWLALTTATPLIVLASVGATKTAYFIVAWQFGIALFALSANMGASMMVETASDQTNLAERWRRVVRHSLLLLAVAVGVLEVGAPLILRIFGTAYAQHATGLLRLLALAALPNLITETAAYAARSQRRTATAAAILTSVSVGMLGLTVLLLPSLGILAVGVACLVAETAVAVVLLSRPGWWLRNPAPAGAGVEENGRVRDSLPSPGAGPILLGTTIALMVVGTVVLGIGLTREETSIVLASLLCNGLALVPLAVFYSVGRQRGKDTADPRHPVPAPSIPIEDYDQLRVDEILPLLQELERDRLDMVRLHEAGRQARAGILCRIDDLVRSEAEVAGPSTPEPPVFPILDYDELRVVDILPLLKDLGPQALEAVAAREEAGARRSTVLSRIARLQKRPALASTSPPADG